MRKFLEQWEIFWFGATYDSRVLALLRIALCLILLKHVTGINGVESPFWRGPEAEYFGRGFYSSYASWLVPPSYEVFVWVGRLCVMFTLLALIGFWARASLFLAAILCAYQFSLNRFFYTNNLCALWWGVLLCSFMPCNKRFSLDSWLVRRRGEPQPKVVRSWAARLLQVLVCLIYVGSATSKLTPAWLSGNLVEMFYGYGKMSLPPWLGFMVHIPMAWQARGAVMMEYFLATALWVPKWRWVVLPLGLGFHIFMDATMSISAFSWQTAAFYLVFLTKKVRNLGGNTGAGDEGPARGK